MPVTTPVPPTPNIAANNRTAAEGGSRVIEPTDTDIDVGTFSVKVDDFTPEHDFNYPQTNVFIVTLVMLSAYLLYLGWTGIELKWVKKAQLWEQPGFWSLVSLAGIVIFGIGHQLTHVLFKPASQATSIRKPALFDDIGGILIPIEFALYFVAYVWLVPKIGYLPTTVIAMPLLTWRVGYRERKWLIISVLFAIGIVVLFKSVLQVRIPGGEIYEHLPDSLRSFFLSRL